MKGPDNNAQRPYTIADAYQESSCRPPPPCAMPAVVRRCGSSPSSPILSRSSGACATSSRATRPPWTRSRFLGANPLDPKCVGFLCSHKRRKYRMDCNRLIHPSVHRKASPESFLRDQLCLHFPEIYTREDCAGHREGLTVPESIYSEARCRMVLRGIGGAGSRVRTELRSTRDGVMIVRVTNRISGWKILSSRMFAAFSPILKLG
jgi:hypothetical protein